MADEERPKKVKRVRKVVAPSGEPSGAEELEEEGGAYRFVTVPPLDEDRPLGGPKDSLMQQLHEVFADFKQVVAINEESTYQFMLWASVTDEVNFQDLLIAVRSIYEAMGEQLPLTKEAWNELKDIAQLMEVTTVGESELEYALEVFSKAFDLFKAEARELERERREAEHLSSLRMAEEILAEDEGLKVDGEEEAPRTGLEQVPAADLGRWEKVVDDTRSKINASKAELDELMEELEPHQRDRLEAMARLRVMEKDAKRKRQRLEWFQRGRISEAKAEEISNLERELVHIEDEMEDWQSRLGIAQERIEGRIGLCKEMRNDFFHIRSEVSSLLESLTVADRQVVEDAMAGEMHDLNSIIVEVDRWIEGLTTAGGVGAADAAAIIDAPPSIAEPREGEARPRGEMAIEPVAARTGLTEADLAAVEPPVVFKDEEVKRILSELPIERSSEEELLHRVEGLQQELINRENTIMELEHTIEKLMEAQEGTTTAVELERNKYRLELEQTREELQEKQNLLEEYLGHIRQLEERMDAKDQELRATLALNKKKTDELRLKEEALGAVERELLQRQEEFRTQLQELQDRESRLNTQVTERETHEREIAKKELTLELRNEQIRKKMDRLTARELELQRVTSNQREREEMLSLKERELQNLKTELDVREDEVRRRENSIEERTEELKRLQSEVSKLEHRVRSRDEAVRRREAHMDEEDVRFQRLEAAMAEREVRLSELEEELVKREAKAEGALASIDTQRQELEELRREVTKTRQDAERVRIAQDHRHEELLRREDALSVREDTLREQERSLQIREDRLNLERSDIERLKKEYDDIEVKWRAREKSLLERLEAFNTEKADLVEEWRAAKRRLRELDRDKADLTARLIAAESSVMDKDKDILELAKELEGLRGRSSDEVIIEFDDGVSTSLRNVMRDIQRQNEALEELEARAQRLTGRERDLSEMEEVLTKERERVRELLAEQERGRADLQHGLDQLTARSQELEDSETSLRGREKAMTQREDDLMLREEALRTRERELERVTTAEAAEARAEDREEELMALQRKLEERTSSLEAREEEVAAELERLETEKVELERQKGELMLARENLLKAGREMEDDETEEVTPVPGPGSSPYFEYTRAPKGLAMRAAWMAAQSRMSDAQGRTTEGEDGGEATGEGGEELRPLARLRCKVCSTVIPIYTEERPLEIVCPHCGKEGILK